VQSQRVDSSVILSVGYDQRRKILKIRFRNGRTYYYLSVPAEIHHNLLTAPSIGKYLNEVIKPTYRVIPERDLLRALRRASKRRERRGCHARFMDFPTARFHSGDAAHYGIATPVLWTLARTAEREIRSMSAILRLTYARHRTRSKIFGRHYMDVHELVRALLAGDLLAARQCVADARRSHVQWERMKQPRGLSGGDGCGRGYR